MTARCLPILLCGLLLTSQALAFPLKPVRVVVPYPTGGGIDILARQLANRLSAQWAQAVVVDNRPGSSTIAGAEAVAHASADGHTWLLTTDATMSINPHLFAHLPYDPVRDFAPVSLLVLLQQILLAQPALGVNSLADLVRLARARAGTINYASYGVGSQPHLAGELLKNAAGIDLVHVPYKGISLAIPAVAAGEVELTFGGIISSTPFIKAGRVIPQAIGGTRRSALLPAVPTFTESGYPEVQTHAWFGLFVPAGTPRAIIDKIHDDVVAIIDDPEYRERDLINKGYDPVGNTPEAFAAYLRTDYEQRGRAVRLSGARSE